MILIGKLNNQINDESDLSNNENALAMISFNKIAEFKIIAIETSE